MTVSVIIPNYNGQHFLQKCISSLLNVNFQTNEYEILMVDNDSSDSSVTYVQSTFPSVKVILLDKNCGFGRSINIAARQARGKYIALLNSDTEVEKNWLSSLVKTMNSDIGIGAVCSKAMLGDENQIQNAGLVLFRQGFGRDRGALVDAERKMQSYEQDSAYFNDKREVWGFSGVSVLIRKDLFIELKGFDELFFMYYEDADFSIRLKKAGYRIVYDPNSVLHHIHTGSSDETSLFFLYHSERSRLVFLIKYYPFIVVIKEFLYFFFQMVFSFVRKRFGIAVKRMQILIWLMLHALLLIRARVRERSYGKVEFLKLYQEMY